MPFVKGQSGNPSGKPKKGKRANPVSIREVWEALCTQKPWLIKEALERGLQSGRPLGFLELGAKVMKEIGQDKESSGNVTIIVNSSLNTNALKPAVKEIHLIENTAHPALPPGPNAEEAEIVADLTLLENGGDDK